MTAGMIVAVIAVCLTGMSMTGAVVWAGLQVSFFAGEIKAQLAQHEIRLSKVEDKLQ